MERPRFTIVTPSFNQLDLLSACIASVRDQAGLLSVEHIVQDAGTAGIEEFAREHDAEFHRGTDAAPAPFPRGKSYALRIFCASDRGMYDAVSAGLKKAAGEIGAYLNCDEQYLPDALAKVNAWFSRNPGADIAFGDIVVVDPRGNYLCDRKAVLPRASHTMVSGNLSVFTAATFFRCKAVVGRGLLFDPSWRILGDAVWILSLLRARLAAGLLHKTTSTFVFSGQNLSLASEAEAERRRLRALAPAAVRFLAPGIVAGHRLRKLLAGAYNLRAHTYEIYAGPSDRTRTAFEARRPTHRWPA